MSTNNEDPHHCHCLYIESSYSMQFRKGLENTGFKEPLLQEDHGQVFGLTKRLDEYNQIHVKVMKNGNIEAEIEYPPDYPFAHLNQTHSYSAHDEMQLLLNALRIPYFFKINPPIACIRRKIVKAVKPTHVKVLLGELLLVGVIGALVYALAKDSKS